MKTIYKIDIHKMEEGTTAWEQGSRYGVFCSKNTGDRLGSASPCKTKQEFFKHIEHMIGEWSKEYDSIVRRKVDEPSKENTEIVIRSEVSHVFNESEVLELIAKNKGINPLTAFFQ
jgi:hypothetical protein